ncbi:amidophosphoribosyltransferase [Corynebacterium caspium]|uniref:amidophosphoribosyltransferase n=1 Tax=Corynebacterium caspium TaxID=234828 RepID=UPI00146151B5
MNTHLIDKTEVRNLASELENPPADECGVFGVWAPGEDVGTLTYFGLFALQHRGQEGAGIAVGDGAGKRILVFKDKGLVSNIFTESTLNSFSGDVAIGHTRYTTAGGDDWENIQPMFRSTSSGASLAFAHNGNIVNVEALREEAKARGLYDPDASDTSVVTTLLADSMQDGTPLKEAVNELIPKVHGAFCFAFTDGRTLYAARDPYGVRPLSLGRLERGWVVASETCALDIVGASFVRDIKPGEIVTIDAAGVHSEFFAEPTPASCIFEHVYLARPDSVIDGRSVQATRVEIGRRLADEFPAEADLVMPVPESGNAAAVGFAERSGIPFGHGVVKNSYVGRTFIQPTQTLRQLGIRLKLNPLRHQIAGKRLVVVDDSIVRGNTQRALVKMLREAGAAEVHVRIASPPVKWPCFYGIDFASPGELIANMGDSFGETAAIEFMRTAIGADSLGFVSIDAMTESTGQPASKLCRACFDGVYPLGLPTGNRNAEVVSNMKGLVAAPWPATALQHPATSS